MRRRNGIPAVTEQQPSTGPVMGDKHEPTEVVRDLAQSPTEARPDRARSAQRRNSRNKADEASPENSKPSGALKKKPRVYGTQDELTRLVLKACLIARDAAFNIKDFLINSSRMAFLAVRDCEKELDQIERHIDERLPEAITRVSEEKARELLACLKFITDLERIGDLLLGVAQRIQSRRGKLAAGDSRNLVEMATIIHTMLEQIHQGFASRELECARSVLQVDAKVDRICHAMFQKHLAGSAREQETTSFDVVLMAQAFERAGDHTKNLAEELYSLIEGHTLRHPPKRTVFH